MADNKIQCPSCGGPNTLLDSSTDQLCVFCGTGFVPQEVEDNTTKIKPENDKTYNWMVMAETAKEGGDYEEAISYFNKILEEDSSHSASWFGKGTSIIWNSKLGDIKMSEALTNYKNAIKFSRGKEMKKNVAEEINSVIYTFYPNIKDHYEEFRGLDNSLIEFFDRFLILETGIEFGLECDPNNVALIDNALFLLDDAIPSGPNFHEIYNEKIEKYIKAKIILDPDWVAPDQRSGGRCFIATATMGDYNHPTVLQLRFFRDAYLLQRNWGRIFTQLYYQWGPYPANVIKNSDVLKILSYYTIVKPLSFIASKLIEKND